MNSYDAYYLIYDTGISNLKLEKIISQDCHYSYEYAREILKGRFELGEEAISNKGNYSYYYAKDILKGRFRLGELTMYNLYTHGLFGDSVEFHKATLLFDYLRHVLRYNHE